MKRKRLESETSTTRTHAAVPLTSDGKQVVFGGENNFTLQLDEYVFGALNGEPVSTAVFSSPLIELDWLRLKEQYYRLLAGSIQRYIELREGELAKRE